MEERSVECVEVLNERGNEICKTGPLLFSVSPFHCFDFSFKFLKQNSVFAHAKIGKFYHISFTSQGIQEQS